MNKPTLLILAAGIGSRYGGLKQLDTFTPEGDTIMDFSIYDAIQAGFGKIVFVIRKSIEKEFRAAYAKKIGAQVAVEFVFQEISAVPKKYQNPNRIKPWGTAHAVLVAKKVIRENFAVINADDFYGRAAFEVMADYLKNMDTSSNKFSMMAYQLKNTVSDYGSVSRGECQVSPDGFLEGIVERTHIEQRGDFLYMKVGERRYRKIENETVVSMNFWGFTPKFFDFAEVLFKQFLSENEANLKAEFFIPIIADSVIQSDQASVKVLQSTAQWFGVTYKEDKEMVIGKVETLRKNKVYPKKLWNGKAN